MEHNVCAIELKGITKRFGEVVANDGIDLQLNRGEILSLLGENGSGKTTLMNMLSGIYFPDEGQIFVNGEPVSIRSPKDAFACGIGMIHQHYKLVDVFTAAENIVLGLEEPGKLDIRAAEEKVRAICEKYGFDIDPGQKIYDMSVSQKQTVEIVKVLYRGAEILILDEPTAVLTPQETDKLFEVLRAMKADGKAIVIITHKLHEVMALSDKVSVLRKGKYIGTVKTSETSPQALTDMMVGHAVTLNIDRPRYERPVKRLEVKGLTVLDGEGVKKLDNVSFTAMGGEILGVAGLVGAQRTELMEGLFGLRSHTAGKITYKGQEIKINQPKDAINNGIAMLTEDRRATGILGVLSIADNVSIASLNQYLIGGFMLDDGKIEQLVQENVAKLSIKTPSSKTQIQSLSGGNQQKVLISRWLANSPDVFIMDEPTRGIDVGAKYEIYCIIAEMAKQGKSIIMISSEMSELIGMSDRIMVMCDGRVTGFIGGDEANQENIMALATQFE